MNYKELLERSFAETNSDELLMGHEKKTRLEFINDALFDFTSYDSEFNIIFAIKAVEVAKAITERTTFEYIEDRTNYGWFLIMVNLPFFKDILSWGTSIRGAWWETPHGKKQISLENCCYFYDEKLEQIRNIHFTIEEWKLFMAAVIEFVDEEMKLYELKGFDLVEKTPEVPQ